MIITVEISFYPLADNYTSYIDSFLEKISNKNITVEIGKMSTLLIGEYGEVMKILSGSMNDIMQDCPSIFNLKIANSCQVN